MNPDIWTQGLSNLFTNVPIWGIIIFFLARYSNSLKEREDKRDKASEDMQNTITEMNTAIQLIKKDLSYAPAINETLQYVLKKNQELQKDVDNCYSRLRDMEARNQ